MRSLDVKPDRCPECGGRDFEADKIDTSPFRKRTVTIFMCGSCGWDIAF